MPSIPDTWKQAFPFGPSTFSNAGGAVSDLFSSDLQARGMHIKATGQRTEAGLYEQAAQLADLNDEFTKQSTAIKQTQSDREVSLGIGRESADIAGAGFSASGSALDLLRDSASQGALTHAVLGQQGLITEAGYEEQANSYRTMEAAANWGANQEDKLASQTKTYGEISAGIKGALSVASVASLFV